MKEYLHIRVDKTKKEQLKKIIPEGNISMWFRLKVEEEIKKQKNNKKDE